MISRDRFELALERLAAADWRKFEKLSSGFLVSEFPQLRTMASASGDGGRDAELCSPSPHVVIQYSVRANWQSKIGETIKRIKETKPEAKVLIYISNQTIGARADATKRTATDQGLFLDIRDRSWFADRLHETTNNEECAEELAKAMVDPLLQIKGIIAQTPSQLDYTEARTALFYLEMQWRDESSGKGLTRSCFEALVRVVLRGTDSEHRVSRNQIYERIHQLLPHHTLDRLKPFIDSAIKRLTKKAIRHWQKQDEFNLSFEETERIINSASSIELLIGMFRDEVLESLTSAAGVTIDDPGRLADIIIDMIESHLMKRGEEFAASVARDAEPPAAEYDIKSLVVQNLPAKVGIHGREPIGFVQNLIMGILNNPSEATAEYVNVLSDAYTLLAFLAETPDVQAVTKKLFSFGEIWLDTTVLLPLFAEQAYPQNLRPFTAMFTQARRAGLKLQLTPGILEEIERHLNRCVVYDRTESWHGRVPYVYTKYALAGRPAGGFRSWAEQFFGDISPERDIADYLQDQFGITVEVIDTSSIKGLSPELITEVSEYWQEVHGKRRHEELEFSLTANRLAQHDIENYIYVLGERAESKASSGLGYKTWWLSLDAAARMLPYRIDKDIAREIKHSPVLSVDYLLRYMAFGPNRDRVNSATSITRVFSGALLENVPPNLVSIAHEVRVKCGPLPERIVQRRIRDALDQQRATYGPVHRAGMAGADEAIANIL